MDRAHDPARRRLLGGMLGAGLMVPLRGHAAPLNEDGLHVQPWFLQSFLDLAEDLEGAAKAGKRLVVIWELRGCPFCRDMHEIAFAQPAVSDYIRAHFEVLQLNQIGSRKVTDFDGSVLGEKELGARYGVRTTPTLLFFPETPDGLAGQPPLQRVVARAPGYLPPDKFVALFRFVRDKAYRDSTFGAYLARGAG